MQAEGTEVLTKLPAMRIMRPMRILMQLALLSAITLLGEAVSYLLPFTFPGTLIAMFILLALMGGGIIREDHLEESAAFFTKYMALFFVPAGVEIVENLELLSTAWLPLAGISVVSLFVTFLAAAKAVEFTEWLIGRRGDRK